MKHFRTLLLCVAAASAILALAGCNDETVADPEIKKSMEDQRQAMPAGGTPPAPPAAGGQ